MMSPELKANWITALRSGKYSQGKNSLRDSENNYCCLGVLCDIIPNNNWELIGDLYEARIGNGYIESSTSVFPFLMRADYGLNKIINDETRETLHERLIDMNDSGSTFAEIADYIKVNM